MDESSNPQDYSVYSQTENKQRGLSKFGHHFVDFIQTLVVFGAIFAIIYLFVAQPHKVSGSSMVPSFQNGDYILTNKVSYRLVDPGRGDVVVLKNPRDPSQDFIKRIIALPGDVVKIDGGIVYVNNTQTAENYLSKVSRTRGGHYISDGQELQIPPGQYFLLGDNREHSSDSREWGTITKKLIIGKVSFRYWPLNSFGLI